LTALTAALAVGGGPGGTVAISAIGGSGGIGKTGLALHWAHQHIDEFPDGQLHVNLRGFDPTEPPTQPAVAIRGFLDALGVAGNAMPADQDARAAMYRSVVAGKRMLIVLDNAADSSHVVPLLPGSPTCTVLVTSRDRLAGLVAGHGARPLPLDVLSEPEARTLLATRLGAGRLAAEPEAVAELLACCGGFPLALSILAGRATAHPEFPLAELAAELRDATTRLGALDEGDPAASLPAVLSWSYAALKPDEAAVFGLLGLAPGPDISVPAAVSLTDLPAGQARATLRALERVSLLQQDVPGRYRMHDLVRLYAVDQAGRDLSEPIRDAALRRLTDFYVHTAHAGDGFLNPYNSPIDIGQPAPGCHPQPIGDGAAALTWFDAEHPNLLATQQNAVERAWHLTVWRVTWALTGFHWLRGHHHDDVTVCRAGLAAAGHLDNPTVLALAHGRLGLACARASQHAEAVEQLQQALTLAEQAGDLPNQAFIHWALGQALVLQGEDRRALEHANQALNLFQAFDNPAWHARALNLVGWNEAHLGDYDQARAHCEAALALYEGNPDREGEAGTLDSLGYIAHHSGRHADALDYYDQALTRWLDLGYTYYEANTLDQLGQTHVALGDRERARAVWRRALKLYQNQHRTADIARTQERLDGLTPESEPGRSPAE
jgi:predicted negative regulator of RcsB-dependent stress response